MWFVEDTVGDAAYLLLTYGSITQQVKLEMFSTPIRIADWYQAIIMLMLTMSKDIVRPAKKLTLSASDDTLMARL